MTSAAYFATMRAPPRSEVAQWIAVGATAVPVAVGIGAVASDQLSGRPAAALMLGGAAASITFVGATAVALVWDVVHLGHTVRAHDADVATERTVGLRLPSRGSPTLAIEVRF